MPPLGGPISLDTVSQVEEIARWGKGSVTDVRYSPYGRFLAVETTVGKYLYDAVTYEPVEFTEERWQANFAEKPVMELRDVDGFTQIWRDGIFVSQLDRVVWEPRQFSPNKAILAGRTGLEELGLWEVSTGKLLHEFLVYGEITPCNEGIHAYNFSSDGQTIAVGCENNDIYLWRVSDASLVGKLPTEGKIDPDSIAFSRDNSLLAAGMLEGQVMIWDLTDQTLLQTVVNENVVYWMHAQGLAFSPDRKNITAGFQNGEVLVWRVSDGELIIRLQGLTPSGSGLDFTEDGKLLAASAWKGALVWQVQDGRLQNELSWQPGGFKLASAAHKALAAWDGPPAEVEQVVISPHGKYLAWYVSDGSDTIQVWSLSSGTQELRDENRTLFPLGLAFSPDDELLAFDHNQDVGFTFWNARDKTRAPVDIYPAKYLSAVGKFSPDWQLWASGGDYQSPFEVWRVSDGTQIKILPVSCIRYFVFSPDSSTVVIRQCQSIDLWRTTDWSIIKSLGDPNYFEIARFSPDGQILATADSNGVIYLWRASDGAFLRTLEGHTRAVNSLKFSPDGRLLASGSREGTVCLWGVR